MIRRVLINLIENSVKYTPNEGAVSVLAHEENNQVIVSIQDNGPGIPEAERNGRESLKSLCESAAKADPKVWVWVSPLLRWRLKRTAAKCG
jgi:glucose-6-phosphate-specific signal transduction histidine kinase